jgi:hypothetical protein
MSDVRGVFCQVSGTLFVREHKLGFGFSMFLIPEDTGSNLGRNSGNPDRDLSSEVLTVVMFQGCDAV